MLVIKLGFLLGSWGFRLRSLCLCSKHFITEPSPRLCILNKLPTHTNIWEPLHSGACGSGTRSWCKYNECLLNKLIPPFLTQYRVSWATLCNVIPFYSRKSLCATAFLLKYSSCWWSGRGMRSLLCWALSPLQGSSVSSALATLLDTPLLSSKPGDLKI